VLTFESFEKSKKKEKGSRQAETPTEKQWHARREAYCNRNATSSTPIA